MRCNLPATPMRLAVLNPGGNDPEQFFPDHAGEPDDRAHAPVNYHAYAACTAGSFHRSIAAIPADGRHVLLLLRYDLQTCLTALEKLKHAGKAVAVSLKESGLHQVAHLLDDPRRIDLFQRICALADGCLASTPELVPLYRAAGGKVVRFIPTPYPVEDPRWDFSAPAEEQRGVFIGTREWDIPSRNHAAALLLAKALDAPVTVVNCSGRKGRKRLAALGCSGLLVVEGPLPYTQYLQLVARHHLLFQLDRSAVPGQVAGDALLCRVPCVGGDGAVERLAFPEWNGHGRTNEELAEIAAGLLAVAMTGNKNETAAAAGAGRIGLVHGDAVSYARIAGQLESFFGSLAP